MGLMAGAARPPSRRPEVCAPAADRPVFRRFCLPRAAAHYRGRWRTACRQRIRSAAGRIPQSLGYLIVRVWNNEVLGNLDGVLQMLASELKIAPHPVPLPAGGERERNGNAEGQTALQVETLLNLDGGNAALPLPACGERAGVRGSGCKERAF